MYIEKNIGLTENFLYVTMKITPKEGRGRDMDMDRCVLKITVYSLLLILTVLLFFHLENKDQIFLPFVIILHGISDEAAKVYRLKKNKKMTLLLRQSENITWRDIGNAKRHTLDR